MGNKVRGPKKKGEICVYCISAIATTGDHVPPRNLFPSPKPADLDTVPACLSCNERFKKDEDWFLGLLSFSNAGISPVGTNLWQGRFNRMYEKDLGLKSVIARSFKKINIKTSSGQILDEFLAIPIDQKRLTHYFEKMVRGMHYLHFKERLPKEAKIRARLANAIPGLENILKDMVPGIKKWEGVYEYAVFQYPHPSKDSDWMFLFYGALFFSATVTVRDAQYVSA